MEQKLSVEIVHLRSLTEGVDRALKHSRSGGIQPGTGMSPPGERWCLLGLRKRGSRWATSGRPKGTPCSRRLLTSREPGADQIAEILEIRGQQRPFPDLADRCNRAALCIRISRGLRNRSSRSRFNPSAADNRQGKVDEDTTMCRCHLNWRRLHRDGCAGSSDNLASRFGGGL